MRYIFHVLLLLIVYSSPSIAQLSSKGIHTVVIDPGHGGGDPGCIGFNKTYEKHITLAVSLKLGAYITANHPEVKVVYTRTQDQFMGLNERIEMANKINADLFISIHCNSFPANRNAYGSETYAMGLHTADENLEVAKRENDAILLEKDYEQAYDSYDSNSPEAHIILSLYQNAHLTQSLTLADKVEKNLKKRNRYSRGVKQAGFLVLRKATMPSILIETGFLSNATEEAFLASSQGQDIVASGIYDAFREYKESVTETANTVATRSFGIDNSPITANTNDGSWVTSVVNPPIVSEPKIITASETPPQNELKKDTTATLVSIPTEDKTKEIVNTHKLQDTTTLIRVESPKIVKPNSPIIITNRSSVESFSKMEYKEQEEEPIDLGKVNLDDPLLERHSADKEKLEDIPLKRSYKMPNGDNVSSTQDSDNTIRFFVQVATSSEPIDTKEGKWLDIPEGKIATERIGNVYNYLVTGYNTFNAAVNAQDYWVTKGFLGAKVVAYQGRKRISVQDAIKIMEDKGEDREK